MHFSEHIPVIKQRISVKGWKRTYNREKFWSFSC